MAADPPPEDADARGSRAAAAEGLQLATGALQALGAVAALVGWVVLVGGIRMHARLGAADIPNPTRTVTVLPREVLLAEGVRTLALPLVIGLVLGLLTYLAASLADAETRVLVGAVLVGVLTGAAVTATVIDSAGWGWMVLVTGVLLVLAVLVLLTSPGPALLGFTVTALVIGWSGASELLTERGSHDQLFEPVQVVREGGAGTTGLLLAKGADDVTLVCVGELRSILSLPSDDVVRMTFQPAISIDEYERREQRGADCVVRDDARLDPPRERRREPRLPQIVIAAIRPIIERFGGPTPDLPDPPSPDPPFPDPPEPPERGPRFVLVAPATRTLDDHARFLYPIARFTRAVTGVASFVTVDPFPLTSGERRPIRLATKAFVAGPGQTAAVRVALSRFARDAIRGRGGVEVRVTVTARGRRGNATTRRDTFTLEEG